MTSHDPFEGAVCRDPALKPAFFREGPLADPTVRYVNDPALRLASWCCSRCPVRQACADLARRQDPRGAMYAGVWYPWGGKPVKIPPQSPWIMVDLPPDVREALRGLDERQGLEGGREASSESPGR